MELRTNPDTDERRLAVLAFQEAADRMIAWIDEYLLGEEDMALLPREYAALVRRRALADDQQLPSEVMRAAERKGNDG